MSYQPLPRASSVYSPLESGSIKLNIRQQPHHALVTNEHKEKGRKPIDPPPIVQMHVDGNHDPNEYWLVNPFLFMMAMLVDAKTDQLVGSNGLIGQNISSLNRLKDVDNKDGGFFVFGDISVRKAGQYKLQFHLFDYDKQSNSTMLLDSITSEEFKVCGSKDFGGLRESTQLSRHFSDQGVRLRLRKEPRAAAGSKRSFVSPPPEPTTPSAHTSLFGNPMHGHSNYGMQPAKRQRTSDDYSGPYLYAQQQSYPVRPPTYGTNFGSDGSGHGWNGAQDGSKGYATDHDNTGLMTPGGTAQTTLHSWPRPGMTLPSTYPTPGGPVGSTSSATPYYSNFAKPGPYLSSQHHQQQHQHQHQQQSHNHSSYAQPIQLPSLPSQPYLSAPPSLRSSTNSDSAYHSNLTGLQTPTSLSDHNLTSSSAANLGSSTHGDSSAGLSSQAPGGNSADLSKSQDGLSQFNTRGLTLEQPVLGLGEYGF